MKNQYGYGIAEDRKITEGHVTDAYFLRTEEALDELDEHPFVTAEVSADQFGDNEYEVFCGLKEAINLLGETGEHDGLPITVEAIGEGTRFDGMPVMRIYGMYRDFARFETPLLGLLSQASGYATAARRLSDAAGDTPVLSFGSRHIHPAMAPYMERAAAVGGVDGYSNVGASGALDTEPSGTMPHALMLSLGNGRQEEAWQGFNEAVDEDIPRIVLVDTFTDEVDEAIRACRELGTDLDGIRLDTTGSRRGDFQHIIREVRHEMDMIGRTDVDIYVSGGIGVEEITELRGSVDGFGVGSAITDADPIDFGLDIVMLNGQPISKRGKLSGESRVNMTEYIRDGEIVKEP